MLHIPFQEVFRPFKPTQTTLSEGSWSTREKTIPFGQLPVATENHPLFELEIHHNPTGRCWIAIDSLLEGNDLISPFIYKPDSCFACGFQMSLEIQNSENLRVLRGVF